MLSLTLILSPTSSLVVELTDSSVTSALTPTPPPLAPPPPTTIVPTTVRASTTPTTVISHTTTSTTTTTTAPPSTTTTSTTAAEVPTTTTTTRPVVTAGRTTQTVLGTCPLVMLPSCSVAFTDMKRQPISFSHLTKQDTTWGLHSDKQPAALLLVRKWQSKLQISNSVKFRVPFSTVECWGSSIAESPLKTRNKNYSKCFMNRKTPCDFLVGEFSAHECVQAGFGWTWSKLPQRQGYAKVCVVVVTVPSLPSYPWPLTSHPWPHPLV